MNEKMLGRVNGIHQCLKCGSNQTTYYQMQTRGADEPMTTYRPILIPRG